MANELVPQALGQQGSPVLVALPAPHHHHALLQIQILDSQPQALDQTEPASIDEHGHEPMQARHSMKDLLHLRRREHQRKSTPVLRPHRIQNILDIFFQDMTIDEDHGIQGLVLGRGGHSSFHGQMGEEVL